MTEEQIKELVSKSGVDFILDKMELKRAGKEKFIEQFTPNQKVSSNYYIEDDNSIFG